MYTEERWSEITQAMNVQEQQLLTIQTMKAQEQRTVTGQTMTMQEQRSTITRRNSRRNLIDDEDEQGVRTDTGKCFTSCFTKKPVNLLLYNKGCSA